MIRPLAIDEMGMSGQPECIAKLMRLVDDDHTSGFARVKAIEALGRLRATPASHSLQRIIDAKQLWRWTYPSELRIAAAQALLLIDPQVGTEKLESSGIDHKDLALEPSDPEPNACSYPPAALRALETFPQRNHDHHQSPGQFQADHSRAESRRRHRFRRAPSSSRFAPES